MTTAANRHDPPLIKRKRANGNVKPQRFVSLHHHSTMSYLDGYALPDAHVRRITELNMSGLAMTEHGNIDSHTQLERAAIDAGVKPIFGCEVYMPAEPTLSKNTQMKFHLTVIARNAEGYHNLVALVTQSNVAQVNGGPYYFEATVTWEMLCARKAGLIILSGCQGSYLACATVGGKSITDDKASLRRGIRVARRFTREFGKWYFIEVQAFPTLDKTRRFNALAGKIARAVGARLVASKDCHYTQVDDAEMQKVLHGVRPGNKQTLEEREREWGYDVPLCPPSSDRSIYRDLLATGMTKTDAVQAIVSTEEIAQECEVTLPKMDMVTFPLPRGYTDAIDYWRDQLLEGWRFREIDKLPPARRNLYRKKLVSEMTMIEAKNFVHYFLLVQAGVLYVKNEKGSAVGPARGSAGASVCAWLLRITEVDPLRSDFNGLFRFDRFIDPERADFPDIDLDFPSEVRVVLRQFYSDMLGEGCVNNVGTFTYYRSKNSLDDVGRVHSLPRDDIERVKSFMSDDAGVTIEASMNLSPDIGEIFEKHPTLSKALTLEGNIRGFGVHAAGIILSNKPITSVTSTAEREVPKGSGRIIQAIGLDKRDAEYRGLLKMDFLGLNTMQMIDDCIHHRDVQMTLSELYAMPLDDPLIYEAFCRNDVVGIFQFDGGATRGVCNGVKPTVFQELMDITSLSRPGPLNGGSTADYIAIKHRRKAPEKLHEIFERITERTRYQIIYQEQIMDVLRDIGGFPPATVNAIRKIVAKKLGEAEFDKYREDFIAGAQERGVMFESADLIFRRMITAGSYSFVAAHAGAYTLISYYTMHFKQYFPHVFTYAALKNLSDDKRKELIRDGKAFGRDIEVKPPSLRKSTRTWNASGGAVLAGFRQFPGVGEKTTDAILEARQTAKKPWRSWDDLAIVKGVGPKTIANIKAFTSSDDPFDIEKISRRVRLITQAIESGEMGRLPIPSHRGCDIEENEGVEYPVVWMGGVVEMKFRDHFEHARMRYGTVLDPSEVKDPELRELVVIQCEDDTEPVIVKVDRWRFPKFAGVLKAMDIKEDVLLVEGKRSKWATARQINARNLWVVDPR